MVKYNDKYDWEDNMVYNSLLNLITYLQYGTKLHIGVLFFGNYGNEKCILPSEQTIHASKICDEFKGRDGGLEKCFRCRNAAIRKAHCTKTVFGGLCINGVYEYTRPVVIGKDVACIIYIGNILEETKGYEKLKTKLNGKDHLLNSLEKNFTYEQCDAMGSLLETYIRILLETIPSKNANNFNPLIENIKNYIETNLEYDMKISRVAKIFHYNEEYLGRLFKKETHMSFSDYVSKQRIERAKRLLIETNDSVVSIAVKVGFNNVTYFNRVFKKYLNMTPLEFRKGKGVNSIK